MEYYTKLRRNELSSHEKTRRKLKCILLSERSLSEKSTLYMIPTMTFCNRQNYGDSKKISGWDFPGGAVVKNPPASAGDTGLSPGLGRSHMLQSS